MKPMKLKGFTNIPIRFYFQQSLSQMESLRRFDEALKKFEEKVEEYKNSKSNKSTSLSQAKVLQYFRAMKQKSCRVLQGKRIHRIMEQKKEFESQSMTLACSIEEGISERNKHSLINQPISNAPDRSMAEHLVEKSANTIQDQNTTTQSQPLAGSIDLSANTRRIFIVPADSGDSPVTMPGCVKSDLHNSKQCAIKTKGPNFKGLIRESLYLRKSISFTENGASVKRMIDNNFECRTKIEDADSTENTGKYAAENEKPKGGDINEKIKYSKEFLTQFFVNLKKNNDAQFALCETPTKKTDGMTKSDKSESTVQYHSIRGLNGKRTESPPAFQESVHGNTEFSKTLNYPIFTNITVDRRKTYVNARPNLVLNRFKRRGKNSTTTNASEQKLILADKHSLVQLMKDRNEIYSKICDKALKEKLESIDRRLFESIYVPFPVICECCVDGRRFDLHDDLRFDSTVYPSELRDVPLLESEKIYSIVEKYLKEDDLKKDRSKFKEKMVQLLKRQDFKNDLPGLMSLTKTDSENEPNTEMVERLLLVLNRGDIHTDLRLISLLDRTIETLSKSKDPFTCKVAVNMAICKKYVEDFVELKRIIEESTSLKL
ncbi:uncharacterized protein VICG_00729 [Vittaforma corneae ATCC 50505]|uniref:Uncharacterized protein n=1 Tax=Vittaforma corneae (strain ATCC 50505) TaxID=993615 RepID=L2GNX9_VITCO|nr:uncharacterized protein VICG_00729 [Vittaforma corneae ATCC 50505]ELA42329.1 hypothetical protein VICG_00729 [Vittaforma corneae ATCC 50505]